MDEKGVAIAGVRVQAERPTSRSPQAPFDSGSARPSITDEEGRFLLRNAPAGELTVTFDHPDYAIATVQTTGSDLGRTVLSRGGTIEGLAVDGEGKPVVGITVHACSQSFEGGGRRNANAVTDEKGRFAMRGLAEGDVDQLRTWDQNYYSEEPKVRTGASDVRIVLRVAAKLTRRVTGCVLPVS